MPIRCLCLCLCALGLFAASSRADDDSNLIEDPSFEGATGNTGLPAGWYGLHTMPTGAYEMGIADEARTGEHSLQIAGEGEFGVVWGEKLPIQDRRQYIAQGFVRVEGDAEAAADVKLHYYGANQEYLGQSRVGFVNPRTEGWQLITVRSQTELFPEAEYLSIAVALAGNGEAWFDDIELYLAGDEAETINYVANGDMEDVAADRPAGWFFYVAEGGEGECNFDESDPHDGVRCMHLKADAEICSAGSVQIPIEAGRQYEVTGFVRASQGTARVGIIYFRDGQFLGGTQGDGMAGEEWGEQTVRTELSMFPEATHFSAVCAGTGEFEAWFDDVRVTAVE